MGKLCAGDFLSNSGLMSMLYESVLSLEYCKAADRHGL
jgi:hypothetical protein